MGQLYSGLGSVLTILTRDVWVIQGHDDATCTSRMHIAMTLIMGHTSRVVMVRAATALPAVPTDNSNTGPICYNSLVQY